jgi:hypothetical protein
MVGLTGEGPALVAGGLCNFLEVELNIYMQKIFEVSMKRF